jgi:hypothetical protein
MTGNLHYFELNFNTIIRYDFQRLEGHMSVIEKWRENQECTNQKFLARQNKRIV